MVLMLAISLPLKQAAPYTAEKNSILLNFRLLKTSLRGLDTCARSSDRSRTMLDVSQSITFTRH